MAGRLLNPLDSKQTGSYINMQSKFKSTEEAIAYILSRTPGVDIATPLGKSFAGLEGGLMKSTINPDGTVDIEGWISTPQKDIEKDILEPESFTPAVTGYMQRGAPVSIEHNVKTMPVGFLQKAMLVRDGNPIDIVDNPKHEKVEFRYFNGGTGLYGRGNIYEEKAAMGVVKGTVSSFSWIGMPKTWDTLPDGGRRFSKAGAIDPLLEVTITAYPINTAATMRIAKAAGYVPSLSNQEIRKLLLNPLVAEAVVEILVPAGVAAQVVNEKLAKSLINEVKAGQQRRYL
jgi:hypothetical protein